MPGKRTHSTSLTDDELTLLDVMFDGGQSFRHLRRSNIWEQTLLRHNLSDDELRDVLKRFIAAGWLTVEKTESDADFYLTAQGGEVWESERRPDWRRLVTDRYRSLPRGGPYVTILALDPQIRDDFWRIGCENGQFHRRDESAKRTVIRNHQWIGWKTFPAIYVLMARQFDTDEINASLVFRDRLNLINNIEQQRTWWRFPYEIGRFWDETANANPT